VSGGLEELFFNRVERAETWRMAANRFFFDRINKINRIGVGVVYIL
jgi:hypothetical protein